MEKGYCPVCTQIMYDPLLSKVIRTKHLDSADRDITAKILPIIKKVMPDSFSTKQITAFQVLFDNPNIFDEIAAMIAVQLTPQEQEPDLVFILEEKE